MFQLLPVVIIAALGLVQPSISQFPPYVTYDKILKSPIDPTITISYKQPEPGTCTTAFLNQKQYTGYINLPPFTLTPYQQNYSINTFFWFVEARTSPETAPLTIWLNGGPGASSLNGFFGGVGPCEVVQLPDGSYGTQTSLWGWDRSSNLLFIDQPTQVGFSYDDLNNASMTLSTGVLYRPRPVPGGVPSWDFLNGTFASQLPDNTQNTSAIAASASWHFLQGFLSAFPQYNPGTHPNSTAKAPAGIHLFAESYGGTYGPAFAAYYETQNKKRTTGEISPKKTLEIKLMSLGIVNGIVDEVIQAPWWPKFAYDQNTYGIQAIDQTTELNALSNFSDSGGCKDSIIRCQNSAQLYDPQGEGDESDTNALCSTAYGICTDLLRVALSTGRSAYDIRDSEPFAYFDGAFLEYLNTAEVQRSIGAKVNFTWSSTQVFDAFGTTGDPVRGSLLPSLADLLDRGIKVAFLYGDADIICNWRGGEQVSLELAKLRPAYSTAFPTAGYADIVVNSTYAGGQVRQFGNLSFARIYDSGHAISSYQPETAFTIFTRVLQGTDISMGKQVNLTSFGTQGPANSTHQNKVPKQPQSTCWIRDVADTCSDSDKDLINQGEGIIKYGVWYASEKDYQPPSSSVLLVGKPGSVPTNSPTPTPTTTSTVPLTGVYTATATPKAKSGASSLRSPSQVLRRALFPIDDTAEDLRRRGDGLKKAVIISAAVLGSLLLLSTVGFLTLCCILLRPRKRSQKDPVYEPPSEQKDVVPEPEAATIPPAPPVVERHATRRPSAVMEPIPEVDSTKEPSVKGRSPPPPSEPRHSMDMRQPSPPGSPRRLSTHPNEALAVPRIAGSQGPTPVPSRRPSIEPAAEATPVASRRPSAAPSREHTPVPSRKSTEVHREPTPAPPSPKEEPTPVVRRATTPPPPTPGPEPEPEPTYRKPSVQDEPEVDEGPKEAQDKAPTPPPRIATAPPPRTPTAKLPSRANTAPLGEVKDDE